MTFYCFWRVGVFGLGKVGIYILVGNSFTHPLSLGVACPISDNSVCVFWSCCEYDTHWPCLISFSMLGSVLVYLLIYLCIGFELGFLHSGLLCSGLAITCLFFM